MLSVTAFAQKTFDLEVTIAKPTSSTVIENGKSFDILVIVKNKSAIDLTATDSLYMAWTLDGNPLPFAIGSQQGAAFTLWNRPIKAGDTLQLNYPGRSLSYSNTADVSRKMCVTVTPRPVGGGTDPVLANNEGCVTMLFKKGDPVSVGQAVVLEGAHNTASIFPNPANAQANVTVNMNTNGEVAIKIIDITGRTVASQNFGQKTKGEYNLPVNVSSLAPGTYFYQVQLGEDKASGKLSITK